MWSCLRLRIVRAVERGSSIRAATRRRAVSPSAAIKLMQRGAHARQPRGAGALWRPASAVARAVSGRPRVSPDLSPIEQLFAKLEAPLRKAAAPGQRQLWATIGRLL
jgi:transposase